jgi:glycosyltransferase involved in cell wall biosynthesis
VQSSGFPDRTVMRDDRRPAVSVIMPSYQVAEYISAAVESVLNQTFTDYEIIVVNDGSPDTVELERALAPYRDRINYIKQENRGCSGARNTAIRRAGGRYIALLDPDDVWEPDYLAVQVGILEKDPSIDVLYPDALIFGDSHLAGRTFMEMMPSQGEVTFEALITQRCNVMISVTARREAIVDAGMFNESLRSSEDFDMWLRILQRGGRIRYHRRVLVHYRRHRTSLSADPVWMCRHILKVLDEVESRNDLSVSETRTLKLQIARFRALACLNEGKRAFFGGDVRTAIDKLTEANSFFGSPKISVALLMLRAAPHLLLRAYNLRDRLLLGTNTKF